MITDPKRREELLAYVAEKYYQEDFRQKDIAERIGVTRSAVSRMLTEAREKGIVEIIVHHQFQYSHSLEEKLKEHFDLKQAAVLEQNFPLDDENLKNRLGKVAARLLADLMKPGDQIGIAWGTTVQATIEGFESAANPQSRVAQLVGVLGTTRHSYSAQTLVDVFAQKIDGEGRYIYSPFIVENKTTAATLLDDPAVEQSIKMGESSNLALVGIGTTEPELCSLLQGQHISEVDLENIRASGAVGDVCGIYFDITGNVARTEFHNRRIGISPAGLRKIPLRLGVAGNLDKAQAILGALRGGYVNVLVTDHVTADQVLKLSQDPG